MFRVVEDPSLSDSSSTISLETLLSKECAVVFERRQRYFVALTLASSHLQPHSTHWLGTQWTKSEITFPLDDGNDPIIERAYLSRAAASSTIRPTQSRKSTDRTFFTLGILLFELCFGVAFEDTVERVRSIPADGPTTYTDLGAAFEWAKRVEDDSGLEYAEAVRWCLSGIDASPKDGKWRKELLKKVVVPLERCHNSLAENSYPS